MGMFKNADIVVQAVLIGLAVASVITWTVWLAKTIELMAVKRRVRADLSWLSKVRTSEGSLERLVKAKSIIGKFIGAAVTELQLSGAGMDKDGIKERIASRPPHHARHRRARHHRGDCPFRRPVRHRLGHHE
jgi:biopolymer transport protein ExbB